MRPTTYLALTLHRYKTGKLVNNVAPAAAIDGADVPILSCMRLWGDGEDIYAEATNRYAAIRGRLAGIEHTPFDVKLSAKLLRRFVREIKPRRGADQHVKVTIGDDITLGRTVVDDWWRVSLAIQEGNFPDLGGVFDGPPTSSAVAAFNANYLTLMPKSDKVLTSIKADGVSRFYDHLGDWVMAIMSLKAPGDIDREQDFATLRDRWKPVIPTATDGAE